jgi:hypothetical protein
MLKETDNVMYCAQVIEKRQGLSTLGRKILVAVTVSTNVVFVSCVLRGT